MKAWIDTEFDGMSGKLISMAIVDDAGKEFYEVIEHGVVCQWVAEHVIPILNKPAVTLDIFKLRLSIFLSKYIDLELIADWPDDIKYFCEALIVGPGQKMHTPPYLTFRLDTSLPDTATNSKIPHNALEDARALRQ